MKIINNKLSRNKRGEDMLVDFWAILVFALIVLLFFIIFSASRANVKNSLEEDFENKDANFMLQSFLRAPAVGYDTDKTIAQIIAEDELKDNFDRTEDLFERYFKYSSTISEIRLEIDGKNDKPLSIDNKITNFDKAELWWSTGIWIQDGEEYDAETYIPGYNGMIYIKIGKDESAKRNTKE